MGKIWEEIRCLRHPHQDLISVPTSRLEEPNVSHAGVLWALRIFLSHYIGTLSAHSSKPGCQQQNRKIPRLQ